MSLSPVIPTSVKVPKLFVRVSLGVGAQSPAGGAKRVVVMGNKLAAGTATDEVVYDVTSPDLAKELFGAGSELALACEYMLDAYPAMDLEAIAIAEAGSAATADLVFTGTSATAAGSVLLEVGPDSITVPIEVGDTPTDIASAIAAAVDDESDWPVAGSSATGTATLTAKNLGVRGNYLWYRCELIEAAGITFTDVNGYLTGGATMDDPQNALDAIEPTRYHYIVSPYQTVTELADFDVFITDQEDPLQAKRGRFFWGSIDTLANTTTVATGLNDPRGQGVWHYNAKQTPLQIAGVAAAEMAEAYETDRAFNTDGLRMRGIVPAHDAADKPIFTELNSALNNGITPLLARGNEVEVVRSVTNYSQDDNSNPDYRVIDTHYVEVADYVGDYLEANFATAFPNAKLGTDVAGEVPDPGVATPETIKDWIFGFLKSEENDLIVDVDSYVDQLVVEPTDGAPGFVTASIPIDVIELLHGGGFDVRQIG